MRISKVLMTGAMLVGGYIASLPVKVAEHTLVGRIADAVSDTFGRLGIRIPGMEGLISKILLLLPYLAVAAIFYLYHNFYVQPAIRAKSMVVVGETFSVKRKVETAIAVFFIACFIVFMAFASYEYRAPASESLKYAELSTLPNYELRERAFAVEKKLIALQNDYMEKQRKVNEPYKKALAVWNKTSEDYQKQLDDYNDRSNPFSLRSLPPTPAPLVGGDIASLLSGKPETTTLLGSLNSGQLLNQSPSWTLPPSPVTPPAPPPPKPERPVLKVNDSWKDAMTEAQQEASAVWGEICQRQGYYPPMFTIPTSYNYPWPVEGDLAEQAKRLGDLANSLH
jgi:hypothetical protein